MTQLKKNRWGRVREIQHVKRVLLNNGLQSAAFKGLPNRLKHLSAWRRMHMQASGHNSVRMFGTRHKVRPSSNLRLSQRKASKVAFIRKKGL